MTRHGVHTRPLAPAALSWVGLIVCGCTEPNPYLPHGKADTSEASGTATTEVSPPASEGEPSSTGTSGQSSGQSSGASGCEALGHACLGPAPEGFTGPIAWLERPADAKLEGCPAPFGRVEVVAYSEISAPAASCGCACGPVGNAGCGDASVVRLAGSCGGAVQDTRDLARGCNAIGGGGWPSNSGFRFDAALPEGGCIPLPTVERPPAAFLTRHTACAGVFPSEGCEPDQRCVPPPAAPFHERWCVWQAGDVPCHEGDYTVRTLLYRDIDDERGCQSCACTLPEGPCEGAAMVLSTAGNCAAGLHEVQPDACDENIGGPNIAGVLYVEGDPPGACDASLPVPTGDAVGTDPITLCCTS